MVIGKNVMAAAVLSVTVTCTSAQSTFSRVYAILQSRCADAGCHGNVNPQVFDISGSQTDVYGVLVGADAFNATAAAKGHKLIAPGYPHRSFLLRKIANGLSAELVLEPSEGEACPKNGAALANAEVELVRQWVMFGAPQSGKVIDEQLLADFYSGRALPEIQAPAPPPAGQGFQIHDGPLFLAPGEEKEFQWKYATGLGSAVEVTKIEAVLSPQSHHHIFYKYNSGYGSSVAEGHKLITSLAGQADVQINASTIATWQYSRTHELPAGTAYFWEAGTVLNSNFHVRNYDDDSILAAHAYLNVYTQPQGSGAVEMFSTLAVYGGFSPFLLSIPNTGTNYTLSFEQIRPETWYIWILQAHTHKLGRDYDIFLRQADGTRGAQVYEGFMDYENNFNRGAYDWAHPSVREFSPLLEVDMRSGLIHEATYLNDGPSDVGFGLTTEDEMFITYMHYTRALPTAVRSVRDASLPISIFPNPSDGRFTLNCSLPESSDVRIDLFSIFGQHMAVLKNESHAQGSFSERFDMAMPGITRGVYFIRLTSGNSSATVKMLLE